MTTEPNQDFYDTIARYYDAENANMTDDLALYEELAEEYGGPVLDVGCGTGRVMLHLARAGYPVVGVDYSEAMLARGRRKMAHLPADAAARVTWHQGDITDPAHVARLRAQNGPFPLILAPYNALLHFHDPAKLRIVMQHLAGLLAPDGLLALDLPNAGDAFAAQDDDGTLVLERTFIEPESGHVVMQQSTTTLDRTTQQFHITWIYDEIGQGGALHRTIAPLHLRYIFASELALLLELCGLNLVASYGDYEQSPFEEGAPRLIALAARAES